MMICNQLMEASKILAQLDPAPSFGDLTKAVCKNCNRIERCPSLSVSQVEFSEQPTSQSPVSQND